MIKGAEPLLIVCDASNGSLGPMLEKFSDAKLHLVLLNEKPDGNFPGHGPNPMEPKALEELGMEVKRSRADFGIGFDADGDRAVFVDDEGCPIPGDEAAYILSRNFKEPYVLDVRAGQIFSGKKTARSPVGHYSMKNLMRKKRSEFGAEPSGHFYFEFQFDGGASYFDSGLRAFVEMINLMNQLKSENKKLSEELKVLPKFIRSGEINLKSAPDFKKIESLYRGKGGKIEKIDGLTVSFPSGGWWFNLRKSNTEELFRLNFEAKDPKVFQEEFAALKALL